MFEGTEPELLDTEGNPLPTEASPRTLAANGEPFVIEFLCATSSGDHRRYEATGGPLKKEGTQTDAANIIIREIS